MLPLEQAPPDAPDTPKATDARIFTEFGDAEGNALASLASQLIAGGCADNQTLIDAIRLVSDASQRHYHRIAMAKFHEALAAAAGEMEKMQRDRQGHHGSYLTLGAILDEAKPKLAKHGISITYSVEIEMNDNGNSGTCTAHAYLKGHCHQQFNSVTLPFNLGDNKLNDAQIVGGVRTYAVRYATMDALGIAPYGEDLDDNASAGNSQRPASNGATRNTNYQAGNGKTYGNEVIICDPPYEPNAQPQPIKAKFGWAKFNSETKKWHVRGNNLQALYNECKEFKPQLTQEQRTRLKNLIEAQTAQAKNQNATSATEQNGDADHFGHLDTSHHLEQQ